jgi:hypothetical protein
MVRSLASLLAGTFALSCVHTPDEVYSEAAYGRMVKTWEGAELKSLVDQLGYPEKERKSPDGNVVYEYVDTKTRVTPAVAHTSHNKYLSTSTSVITGGHSETISCQTWFEIADGRVKKVTWKGRACKARDVEQEATEDTLGIIVSPKKLSEGFAVAGVAEGTAAHLTGIQKGDVVTMLRVLRTSGDNDAIALGSARELAGSVSYFSAFKLEVEVVRNKKRIWLPMKGYAH